MLKTVVQDNFADFDKARADIAAIRVRVDSLEQWRVETDKWKEATTKTVVEVREDIKETKTEILDEVSRKIDQIQYWSIFRLGAIVIGVCLWMAIVIRVALH